MQYSFVCRTVRLLWLSLLIPRWISFLSFLPNELLSILFLFDDMKIRGAKSSVLDTNHQNGTLDGRCYSANTYINARLLYLFSFILLRLPFSFCIYFLLLILILTFEYSLDSMEYKLKPWWSFIKALWGSWKELLKSPKNKRREHYFLSKRFLNKGIYLQKGENQKIRRS